MKEVDVQTTKIRKYFQSKSQLLKQLLNSCDNIYYESKGDIFLLKFTEANGFCVVNPPYQHDCTKFLIDFKNIEYEKCFIYTDKNWWENIPRNIDLNAKGFLVSVGISTNPPVYINKVEENSDGMIVLYSNMTGRSYFVEDCFPCDLRSLEKFCLDIR